MEDEPASLSCLVCGGNIEILDRGLLQPYEATMFTTPGHYGSTVFDPMNGDQLRVTVCDPCLLAAAGSGRVHVIAAGSEEPATWNAAGDTTRHPAGHAPA